jgi:hypothetical protein
MLSHERPFQCLKRIEIRSDFKADFHREMGAAGLEPAES